ncbi:MAG: type II secretion system protein N [Oceanicoccus sp.]
MKWFLTLLVAVIIVAMVVVVRLPASLVPIILAEVEQRNLLSPESPRLLLQQTSGTFWQGQASESIVEVDGVSVPLGVLNWKLSPLSLLRLQPSIHLSSSAPDQILSTTVSVDRQGQVTIAAMEGRLPIRALEPWFPMLIRGDIAFVIDHLIFKDDKLLAVDGVLNLEYIDWVGGDYGMPLGSYMAHIYQQEHQVLVQFDDFDATLGVNGVMNIDPDGAYTFNAELQPRDGLASEVNESIAWFGKRQANGNVLIKTRGHL